MVQIPQHLLSSINIYSAGDAFPILDMNSPAGRGAESLTFRISPIPTPALLGTLPAAPGWSLSLSLPFHRSLSFLIWKTHGMRGSSEVCDKHLNKRVCRTQCRPLHCTEHSLYGSQTKN